MTDHKQQLRDLRAAVEAVIEDDHEGSEMLAILIVDRVAGPLAADRDRARAIAVALEQELARVRAMHSPTAKTLDDDEATKVTVCRECDALRESCSDEAEPEPWPCATIRAMDGGEASC